MSPPDAPRPPGGTGGRDSDRPARLIPLDRTPYGIDAAQDAASDADRRYFERHPDETEYIRLAVPGELPIDLAWVRVVQLSPGVRIRQPWVAK